MLNGIDGIIMRDDGTYIVKDFILKAVAVTSIPADPSAELTVRNYIEANKALISPPEEEIRRRWYLFS